MTDETAAPAAEGLDVERLARVLWETDAHWRFHHDKDRDVRARFQRFAERIAAEYARLGEAADAIDGVFRVEQAKEEAR